MSPFRRQVVIWTNADSLSIGPVGTNIDQFAIKIRTYSWGYVFKICWGLNVLTMMQCIIILCKKATLPLWHDIYHFSELIMMNWLISLSSRRCISFSGAFLRNNILQNFEIVPQRMSRFYSQHWCVLLSHDLSQWWPTSVLPYDITSS